MWQKMKDFLKGALREVFGFLDPLAREIARNGGRLLLEAAIAAVLAAEKQGGSGEDKLKAARAAAIDRLETRGITVAMNALNGALEAAVAKRKEDGMI